MVGNRIPINHRNSLQSATFSAETLGPLPFKRSGNSMSTTPPMRHKTVAVQVGGVTVGGGTPIVVQSMTNTDTADV
ncbi:MAG: hypothetical protein WCD73_02030, partial [Pseudolabrys sp.]